MENEDKLVVFNKYANPVDANIVKGALEAVGIPAGVIGDSLANNLWKEAIKTVYGSEMRYEDFQEEMDRFAFENLQACNRLFCELALKIHPELGGSEYRELYAKARLAVDEGDLKTLEKIQSALQ